MTDDGVVSIEQPSTIASNVLLAAKQQDPEAWRLLIARYSERVYKWARKAGLQDSDAADVTQQVFAAAAAAIANLRRESPGDSLGGWLYRVTQNRIHDFRRRTNAQLCGAKGGSTNLKALLATPDELPSDTGRAGEQSQLSPREREALRAVEERCDPKTWKLFLRVTAEDVAVEQVAEEFGVAPNVVYLAKSRITRRIREEMAKRRDE